MKMACSPSGISAGSYQSRVIDQADVEAWAASLATDTPRLLPRDVRRIFVGNYEMHYESVDLTIYILRSWHTREER